MTLLAFDRGGFDRRGLRYDAVHAPHLLQFRWRVHGPRRYYCFCSTWDCLRRGGDWRCKPRRHFYNLRHRNLVDLFDLADLGAYGGGDDGGDGGDQGEGFQLKPVFGAFFALIDIYH